MRTGDVIVGKVVTHRSRGPGTFKGCKITKPQNCGFCP